jgi:hypothetical protein
MLIDRMIGGSLLQALAAGAVGNPPEMAPG